MHRLLVSLFAVTVAVALEAAPKPLTDAQILKGTPEQKRREEQRVAEFGLSSHETFEGIEEEVRAGTLVRVESTKTYTIDPRMGSGSSPEAKRAYRTLRPHTKQVLEWRAGRYYAKFHVPLLITGLTRSEQFLAFLLGRKNSNASLKSSHLFGVAFDIGYELMTPEQVRWIEQELAPLERAGRIEAIKEGDPGKPEDNHCFHVMDRFAVPISPKAPR